MRITGLRRSGLHIPRRRFTEATRRLVHSVAAPFPAKASLRFGLCGGPGLYHVNSQGYPHSERQEIHLYLLPFVVRITGLEPARSCPHMDLNHTRLPIPPYPQKRRSAELVDRRFVTVFYSSVFSSTASSAAGSSTGSGAGSSAFSSTEGISIP